MTNEERINKNDSITRMSLEEKKKSLQEALDDKYIKLGTINPSEIKK